MDSNREGKSQGTRNTVSGFMSHKMEIFLAMRTWIVQKMVLWSFQGEHRLHTLKTKSEMCGKSGLPSKATIAKYQLTGA